MITTHENAPDFTHLLTTNTIPSQHDRNTIHNTLSSIDKDVSQAEIDIARVKKVLEERVKDHAALIQRRASLWAVVSPLRQLPLEIFGLIFAYATLDDRRFPISASHVCRLWRQASLASSDLWTTIWIENRCQKEYVALFIQRSQSRPLSLKYSRNFPLDSLPDISTFLPDVGCDYQWKEIHVHVSWDNLPKLLSKSWDTLESLVLSTFKESRDRDLHLASATRLKRLTIIRDNMSKVYYHVVELPCHGLTHLNLDIGIKPPYEIISILSECGNLEEFVLTLTEPVMLNQSAQPQTPAYLPNLRKLHLHTRALDHLVKWLATPVVKDLLLDPMCRWMDFRWRDKSVIKFINASKLTLRKFSIYMVSGLGLEVVVMLKGMKGLSEFMVVGNDDFDWEDLEAMIVKDRGTVTATSGDTDDENIDKKRNEILLPNLEVLHVICKTDFSVQKAFLDVVRSRWWPENDSRDTGMARLKTASLQSISTSERLAFGAEVDDIRRQGFDIKMLEPQGLLEGQEVDWVVD